MKINEFIQRARLLVLYHFTDVSNLPLIKEHGLLSFRELSRRGIRPPKPGGNDISRQQDAILGLDGFVHLCLKDQHPMEFRAREAGRIGPTIFLMISRRILQTERICGCPRVANRADAVVHPLEEALDDFDMEVLFDTPLPMVLGDEQLKKRYMEAKKSEILVPDHIPTSFILNLNE